MYAMRMFWILAFALVCLSSPALSQVHRWVDENGKVHFGDRIPEKYKDSAEAVDTSHTTIISPEADIRKKNQKQFRKMEADAKRVEKQKRLQEKRDKRAQKRTKAKAKADKKNSQEYCRNRFPNNVKKRTECFNRVAKQD